MPHLLSRARDLRRNATDAERLLWSRLRAKQLPGLKFRRQQPIGPFIADFVCQAARVAVEVDGGQHAGSESDERRDLILRGMGYRVLRFWNREVLADTDAVLDVVMQACLARRRPSPPSPRPLPSRAGDVESGDPP